MSESAPTQSDVLVERRGAVYTVRLNRPETRNALLPSTTVRYAEAIEAGAADPSVRVIVITGTGAAFCAGADLVAGIEEAQKRPYAEVIREGFHRLIRAVVSAPKPVVASIRGPAVGFGFDLALAADLRIASRASSYGAVFSKIGLVPDGGSSFTLSRLVGLGRAMELVLLGDTFDAARADALGLLYRVVDDAALESETGTLTDRLAAGPPMAYRLAKRNLISGLTSELRDAFDAEIEAQVKCLASADMMEGVQAFLQKRKPNFVGR